MDYDALSKEQLKEEFLRLKGQYEEFKSRNLSLDMSRGKPSFDQLEISDDFFNLVNKTKGFKTENGTDCRNYGLLDGIPELKRLFGEMLGVPSENVIVGGNSSLNMMFDTIAQGMTQGFGEGPWLKQGEIKFLCPAPGYDRHFGICEFFGIKMINIKNNPDGPDMDAVEELIKDKSVKGIWCVPKYSNPEGIVYSDEVVRRFANLKPAAKDFRVFWDNAYAMHTLYEDQKLLNIFDECRKAGNENLVIQFASTSKITFPGGGIAVECAGDDDLKRIKSRMNFQTIGPDKLNQLRHARMFKTLDDLKKQMEKHAEILRPKFEIVLKSFKNELTRIAEWTEPMGGYFISLTLKDGLAKRVHTLCSEAGLVLTDAGATYPYGKDPYDNNLRIAPTFPPLSELSVACELLCTAVKYATVEKMLG